MAINNKITKTVTLQPGEVFQLPPDAVVIAHTGNLSSTCGELPEAETQECFVIQWEMENDNVGSDAWENAIIDYLFTNGNKTQVNCDAYLANNDGAAILTNAMLSTGLFSNLSTGTFDVGDMQKFGICFKTITSVGLNTYLQITTGDNTVANIYARKRSAAQEPPCNCAA